VLWAKMSIISSLKRTGYRLLLILNLETSSRYTSSIWIHLEWIQLLRGSERSKIVFLILNNLKTFVNLMIWGNIFIKLFCVLQVFILDILSALIKMPSFTNWDFRRMWKIQCLLYLFHILSIIGTYITSA
jgi:hypothetical protein